MTNLVAINISPEQGLKSYLQKIQQFPLLEQEEEQKLAKDWQQYGTIAAAHRLVTSHLRLVVKIAGGFKGYGLPFVDLISEGNIGLMQAVQKFDPKKGFRLATYAMWWIKASIQEYVLRSWSMVKIGTSASQKKLFFNLNKIKRRIQGVDEGMLTPEQSQIIAEELGVSQSEVQDMHSLMNGGELYLDAPISDENGSSSWIDKISDDRIIQDDQLEQKQEVEHKRLMLKNAMSDLDNREQDIIIGRRLSEPSLTLEELSQKHKVSRERIRQIESKAVDKLRIAMNGYLQIENKKLHA